MSTAYHTETSLSTLTHQFLEQGRYLRGWSPRTVRTYRQNLSTLETGLAGAAITKSTLQRFVIWMRDKGLTASGCNVRIRAVNSFLTWLHEEGSIAERLKLKVLRAEQKAPHTVNPIDVRKLLVFRPKGTNDSRAWVLVMLLLDTGLRIDEALGLERKNVDLDQMFLRVKGKGSKERLVPISTEGRKHLFRWLQKRSDAARFVFCTHSGGRMSYRNAYRDITTLCERLGVSDVHPHCFRHSFACNYIQRGGDIYRLSRVLGHASINTTQLYLRSMGIEQIREGHDALSPLAV